MAKAKTKRAYRENELSCAVARLRELEAQKCAVDSEIKLIKDRIKGYMTNHKLNEHLGVDFIITYKSSTRKVLDREALNAHFGKEVIDQYTKESYLDILRVK